MKKISELKSVPITECDFAGILQMHERAKSF